MWHYLRLLVKSKSWGLPLLMYNELCRVTSHMYFENLTSTKWCDVHMSKRNLFSVARSANPKASSLSGRCFTTELRSLCQLQLLIVSFFSFYWLSRWKMSQIKETNAQSVVRRILVTRSLEEKAVLFSFKFCMMWTCSSTPIIGLVGKEDQC